MSSTDPNKDPEVFLVNQKSVCDPDFYTDFVEFDAKMKANYGRTAISQIIKSYALGGNGGERGWDTGHLLIFMCMNPIVFSIHIVFGFLGSKSFKFAIAGFLFSTLVFFGVIVAWVLYYRKHYRSKTACQKSIPDPEILEEFADFEAEMKKKYGKKATDTNTKFFELGTKEREQLHFNFSLPMTLCWLSLMMFNNFYLSLRSLGYDFLFIAFITICIHILSLYQNTVNIYHNRYSQLFSLPARFFIIFIVIIAFATHCSVFFLSSSSSYRATVVSDRTH